MTFIQTELVHALIHLTDTFMTIRLVDRIFRKQQSKWHRAEFCFGIFYWFCLKREQDLSHKCLPSKRSLHIQQNIRNTTKEIYFVNTLKVVVIIVIRYSFWSKNKCREFYKTTCCKTFNKVASIPLQTTFHSASGSRFLKLIIQKYVVWLT